MLTASGKWSLGSALVLFASGWVFQYRILFVLAYALIAALLLAMAWVLRQPSLSAFQHVQPAVVGAGEPAHATVITTNTGRRSNAPLIASNIIDGAPSSVAIPKLEPGGQDRSLILLPTTRRGHFDVGPLTIDRSDPFGLLRRETHQGSIATLVVHPEIHPMTTLPTGHRRELEGARSVIPQEGGISFHSLRDYVAGDDLRLIHWRSVAKTGSLMVRKNIVTSEPRLMVVLDTWSGSYATPGKKGDSLESFEDAVRVAASLVSAGCESHYPVLFRTTGGIEADAGSTGEGRIAIMRILAGIQTTEDDPGLNAVIRFADQADGVSLGAITGQPPAERIAGISRVRPRFDMVTVVQVGEAFDRPPMEIAGAMVINGATSHDVADRWKAAFG